MKSSRPLPVVHLRRFAGGLACLAALAGSAAAQSPAPAATPAAPLKKTTVTSDRLEARNTGVEGHYVFIGHVRITGTNLEVTCDRVEVFSVAKPEDGKDSPISDAGNIRRMLATGNVVIAQEARKAECGTAEVLPIEQKIILTDNPIITDEATGVTMKGTRMTVYRGERYAEIEHPEVVGPALPNLGFATPKPEDGKPAGDTPPAAAPPKQP
jgi:lipopolysaccharide export system protein LptA